MTYEIATLLFAAGFAGGVANAIAGGATLITFPAMLAAGLPPIIANASNAVAVTPGHFVAAIADREKLPPFNRSTWLIVAAGTIGGAAGAFLLLETSERTFTLLVPALIGLATLVFAFAKEIQKAVTRVRDDKHAGGSRPALIGVVSIYGGYFGAGLGIMLLAALSITGKEEVRAANAVKNLLATCVSVATICIFAAQNAVSWPETLVMMIGAICGGFAGGRLIKVLPPAAVRAIVIAVGTGMTALYAWRYWF